MRTLKCVRTDQLGRDDESQDVIRRGQLQSIKQTIVIPLETACSSEQALGHFREEVSSSRRSQVSFHLGNKSPKHALIVNPGYLRDSCGKVFLNEVAEHLFHLLGQHGLPPELALITYYPDEGWLLPLGPFQLEKF